MRNEELYHIVNEIEYQSLNQWHMINHTEQLLADLKARQLLQEDDEPRICSVFGCGRVLKPQETLYSNKCFYHAS